jgi:hypothetical protein
MVKITKDQAFREFIENECSLEEIFPLRSTPKVKVVSTIVTPQSKHHTYNIYFQWRCNYIGNIDEHTRAGTLFTDESIYEEPPYNNNEIVLVFNKYFERFSSENSYVKMISASSMKNDTDTNKLPGKENVYMHEGYKCAVSVVYYNMSRIPYPSTHFTYESRISQEDVDGYIKTIEILKKKNSGLIAKMNDAVVDFTGKLEVVNAELESTKRNRNYYKNRLTDTKVRMKTTILALYGTREDKICGVCIEPISQERLVVTNCCHLFCKQCVDQWTNSARENSKCCPECRMKNYLE